MKLCIALVALSVSACWSSDPPSDAVAEAERPLLAASANPPVSEFCRTFLTRQRDCAQTFLPALVAARVEQDNPPGIAALDAKQGREALLSEALDEYADDSKDTAISARCEDIAAAISSERAEQLLGSGTSCLNQTGCEAFVACAVPLSLERWKQ
jgi:hypothetical protein